MRDVFPVPPLSSVYSDREAASLPALMFYSTLYIIRYSLQLELGLRLAEF